MTPSRLSWSIVAAATLLTGCTLRTYERDHAAISARYPLSNPEKCTSWLISKETGYAFCGSPAFYAEPKLPPVPAIDESTLPQDMASLKAKGEKIYGRICVTCHQADGQGTPGTYPPLAGAGEFYGTAQNMAGIVINGLNGPITVNGAEFDNLMPPQGDLLSNYQIAAVTTYVRNSFGNEDGIVTLDDVKAAR